MVRDWRSHGNRNGLDRRADFGRERHKPSELLAVTSPDDLEDVRGEGSNVPRQEPATGGPRTINAAC